MDHVIYSKDCIFDTDCNITGINNNAIICGPSGSGKTMSITEPYILESFNRSLVITVTKKRIVNKYTPLLKKRGYLVQDLDLANPQNGNIGFDPLKQICSYQDITFLADSIVKADPKKNKSNSDPYWDQGASSLLCALISYVLMTYKNPSFTDVLDMLIRLKFTDRGSQVSTSYDSDFEYLEALDPTCFAVSCWKSFSMLPVKTAGCIYSTLQTTVDNIFTPQIKKMMKMKKQIDIERIGCQKSVLFITTSPVNSALHFFVNMLYGHIFRQLFEFAETLPSGVLPIPVQIIADDFATGAKILNFADITSIVREKNIGFVLLAQSESQISGIYGSDDATTIINNCDTYVYMGGNDLKTAQNVSLKLNVPLDEVLYMPIGQEIVFRRGQRPMITERYDIMQDKVYQQVTSEYEKKICIDAR